MKEILKNLFCLLYSDYTGFSWMFWVFLICFILFPIFIFCIIIGIKKYKAGNLKFIKLCIPFYVLCIFCFYQLIPVLLFFCSYDDVNGSLRQLAIKTSLFPYQKGAYYCNSGTYSFMNKDYKNSIKNYEEGYKYLKGYDFPCWEQAFLDYYKLGKYDKSMEILNSYYNKNHRVYNVLSINIEGFVSFWHSNIYIMQEDYPKALESVNATIQISKSKNKNYLYAKRGFIYRQLKKEDLAKKDLEKALTLCKDEKEISKIKNIYYNFRNIELERNAQYINALEKN